ncbi:MAG: methyl-accepting chemotaxis protein [Bacillota bacterium]|nr:methyl-accepting chemotaxis protein [Bacillota bacterium]MDW7683033.1 methyl-accepting chemotaxis protein [Bacillota bacterium]
MKISIRYKIALSMIALLLVSASVIGVSAYQSTVTTVEEMRQTEFENILEEVSQTVRLNIDNTRRILSFMSLTPAMEAYREEGNLSAVPELLEQGVGTFDRIETLLLTDSQGSVVASSDKGQSVGVDLSDREYFHSSKQGNIVVSEVITSRITGSTAFTIAIPLLGQNGSFNGTLVAVLGFDSVIGNYVQNLRVGESGYAWMVDREGLVVSHPNQEHILQTNLAQNENQQLASIAQSMGQGDSGYGFYTFEGVEKLTVYQPLENWGIAFSMDVQEYMQPAYHIRNRIILVVAIFILAGLMISTVVARQIGNPVVAMMQAMKKAETGDLTVNVNVESKDEIGQLSTSFNTMLAGQRQIIAKVLESASSVSAASQELSAAVEESNAAMQEISSTVESEVAASAQNIALSSDKAAESGRHTRGVAKNGVEAVEEAGAAMKEIDSSAREVSGVIGELDEASKQIGMIINTITDIAEQTNLLALNAAIEAARAGEQGRGFAVVAEEVRKLAEGSSKAAGEIGDLIMNIQNKTGNAVNKMADAGRIVDKGATLAECAQQFLGEIRKAVGQVGDLIEDIATAAQEQSASAEEISASTQEQTGVLEEIAATTDELASMAENLNALVSHFKI